MEAGENQRDKHLENGCPSKLKRRAINQFAIGSIILFWGILLALKQVGMIERNVSTWPFALTAFGILLVAGGIYRLSRSRR
jgi:hypothetical protein